MPFLFDCQKDTVAPASGVHAGDSTTPVSTCPLPIFARSGMRPGSRPKFWFGVGAHCARTDAAAGAADETIVAIATAETAKTARIPSARGYHPSRGTFEKELTTSSLHRDEEREDQADAGRVGVLLPPARVAGDEGRVHRQVVNATSARRPALRAAPAGRARGRRRPRPRRPTTGCRASRAFLRAL